MFLVTHAHVVVPGYQDVSYRAVGLTFMAVSFLLAFFSPVFAGSRMRVATAQLAGGLFALLTAIGVLVLASVIAIAFPGSDGDESSVSGIVLLASAVLPLGALLIRYAANSVHPTNTIWNVPLFFACSAALALDIASLGSVWLDSTSRGNGSPVPDDRTVLLLFGYSLLVTVAALFRPVDELQSSGFDRRHLSGFVLLPFCAAVLEVALIVLRGPSGWYTGTHVAGLDLMLASVLLGVTVFLTALMQRRENREEKDGHMFDPVLPSRAA